MKKDFKNRITLELFGKLILFLILFYQAGVLVRLVSLMPIYNPIDELYHYDYILKISEGRGRSSNLNMHPQILASICKYGYRATHYHASPPPFENEFEPDLSMYRINDQIHQHPPLYYWIMSFFISTNATPMTQILNVHGLRLLGVFLFLLGGFLWISGLCRLVGMEKADIFMLIMLWAWTPPELFRVSNDMGVFFVSGLTIYIYSLTEHEFRRKKPYFSILLGLCLGACALTKYTLVYLLLPPLCYGRWRRHLRMAFLDQKSDTGRKDVWIKSIRSTFTDPALLVCFVILLIFLLTKEVGVNKLKVVGANPIGWTLKYLSYTLFWGESVWLGQRLAYDIPVVFPILLLVLFPAGWISAFLFSNRIRRDDATSKKSGSEHQAPRFIGGMIIWMILIQTSISIYIIPWFCQGRYLIPVVPLMIALMTVGFYNLGKRFPLVSRRFFAILAVILWVYINTQHLSYVIYLMNQ